eukprot:g3495.t1
MEDESTRNENETIENKIKYWIDKEIVNDSALKTKYSKVEIKFLRDEIIKYIQTHVLDDLWNEVFKREKGKNVAIFNMKSLRVHVEPFISEFKPVYHDEENVLREKAKSAIKRRKATFAALGTRRQTEAKDILEAMTVPKELTRLLSQSVFMKLKDIRLAVDDSLNNGLVENWKEFLRDEAWDLRYPGSDAWEIPELVGDIDAAHAGNIFYYRKCYQPWDKIEDWLNDKKDWFDLLPSDLKERVWSEPGELDRLHRKVEEAVQG